MKTRFALLLSLCIGASTLVSCALAIKPNNNDVVEELQFESPKENSVAAQKLSTTIVVSIDGYRADYNAKFAPPTLTNLERTGASARSLKPVYPSKTFPNHYTLVTGLYPAKHGIVSNEFYDPARARSYAIADRAAVEDGSWYSGEPIWITAQKNGIRTASFFWVGSEAGIQGMSPNYYYRYSQEVPNAARVDRVLQWLTLPEIERPHLIMMYFSSVDTAGHRYGTNSKELREAVIGVDEQIGRLREGIKASGKPVNLIVVSDHGMQDLDPAKVILIDESPEVGALIAKFKVVGRGPQTVLYLNEGENPNVKVEMRDALRKYARTSQKPFRVMMTQAELKKFSYNGNPRTGDLVIDPDLPWALGTKAMPPSTAGANHGWDPKYPTMHAVFFAEGPSFRSRSILPTVDNIHVAPTILKTLGVKPPAGIDGNADAMKSIMK